jgi:hypothetical protein
MAGRKGEQSGEVEPAVRQASPVPPETPLSGDTASVRSGKPGPRFFPHWACLSRRAGRQRFTGTTPRRVYRRWACAGASALRRWRFLSRRVGAPDLCRRPGQRQTDGDDEKEQAELASPIRRKPVSKKPEAGEQAEAERSIGSRRDKHSLASRASERLAQAPLRSPDGNRLGAIWTGGA